MILKNHISAPIRKEKLSPTSKVRRKVKNFVEGRPSRAETGLAGEKMELDSRKKSRRDRTTPSKSFETLEVREISQKQLIGFFILWMGTIEHVFWMEGKDRKEQEILKI